MSEKLVVRVKYALEEKGIKKNALEKGDFLGKIQNMNIPFAEIKKELREKIYKDYYKNSFLIIVDITDRSAVSGRIEKEIELFYNKQADKEKMMDILEEYFELKELDREIFHERLEKEIETRKKIKTIPFRDMPRLIIHYPISKAFAKDMLIKEGKLLKGTVEFSISSEKIDDELLGKVYEHGSVEEEKDELEVWQNVLKINLFSPNMNGHRFNSFFTEENVNENLSFYFDQLEKTLHTKDDKKEWVETYGSEHLKRATRLDYNCQRLYVAERAEKEYPGYTLDFDEKEKFKDRSCPSEISLDLEEKIREKDPDIQVRIKWRETKTFKGEVIVITEYLGKYTIYKEIEETNELN